MTTIATDGVSVASDGRTSAGERIVTDSYKKLTRLPDGSVVGSAGRVTDSILALEELAESVVDGRLPKLVRGDYAFLRLEANGRATVYDSCLVAIPVPTPYAVGSGGDYALGALHHGACSANAVRIAKKLDRGSGGRISTMQPKDLR